MSENSSAFLLRGRVGVDGLGGGPDGFLMPRDGGQRVRAGKTE